MADARRQLPIRDVKACGARRSLFRGFPVTHGRRGPRGGQTYRVRDVVPVAVMDATSTPAATSRQPTTQIYRPDAGSQPNPALAATANQARSPAEARRLPVVMSPCCALAWNE
jgi:hypothetical protein